MKILKYLLLLASFFVSASVLAGASTKFIIAESEFLKGDYKNSKGFYLKIFQEAKTEYVLRRIIESSVLSSDRSSLADIVADEGNEELISNIGYEYRLSLLLMAGRFETAADQIKMILTESLDEDVVSTLRKTIYSSLGYNSGLKFIKKYKIIQLLE